MKFCVTAWRPFITGAARLVPPTCPLLVVLTPVVSKYLTPVFGSATAETSGLTRPGHDAFAVTPAPVCQAGRLMMLEHQLPLPLHVVLVLHVLELLVEYVLVPPTETT